MIYTIGYQRLALEQLDAVLDELACDLIDVRSMPFSRNPSYRLPALRKRYGARYFSAGHMLGGIPKAGDQHQVTAEGIDWLKPAMTGARRSVLLLCLEENPAHCHRHQLICAPHFPEALHVFRGGLYLAIDVTRSIASAVQIDVAPVRTIESWSSQRR
jgi:uncharacterized protein (DUF488 family)